MLRSNSNSSLVTQTATQGETPGEKDSDKAFPNIYLLPSHTFWGYLPGIFYNLIKVHNPGTNLPTLFLEASIRNRQEQSTPRLSESLNRPQLVSCVQQGQKQNLSSLLQGLYIHMKNDCEYIIDMCSVLNVGGKCCLKKLEGTLAHEVCRSGFFLSCYA